jgi:hypothetical protein
MDAQNVGDSHQIGKRPSPHFAHYVHPVDLYGDFADTQIRRDPLIPEAGAHERYHVALAGSQRFV